MVEAARFHRTRDRRERGLTLLEGPQLISDAVAAGAVVRQTFGVDPDEADVTHVDMKALERLAGTESPRGPVAVVEIPVEWLNRSNNLLVSVGVSDPGNVGTMIRSAASFGWGFAYTQGSADPWAPKALRAGAAGQFQTSVSSIGSLGEIDEWVTVATVVQGGDPPDAIGDRPVALLIGEEAHGLPSPVANSAAHRLTIPTPGATESLNAAVASGIALYALTKNSGQSKGSGQDRTGV